MGKINVNTWQEFIIGDLFEVKRPSARSQSDYEKGPIPFIASGNFNNGITGYCTPKKNEILDKGNSITISPLDGSAFYQENDFLGRGGAGSAIIILYNDNLNRLRGLFLASAIRHQLTKYSYNNQLSSKIIIKQKIYLPATKNNEPDWEFMETYMKDIETRTKTKQSELFKILDTDDKTRINTNKWKEFMIGDLFDIHPTKHYNNNNGKALSNSQLLDSNGKNPVVVNSAYNNGVGGYSNLPCNEKGGIITFSDTTTSDAIFYQENDFIGYSHVQGMYPKKYQDKWSKYSMKFFEVVFKNRAKTLGYNYVNKFTRELANKMIVQLPVNRNNEPDWDYMETYMKNIENKVNHSLSTIAQII